MRSTAKLVAVMMLVLASANASEWKTGTCSSQPIKEIRKHTYEQELKDLHRKLSAQGKHGDFHDLYLRMLGLGNKETVRLLIERLRLDYGPEEPTPRPGVRVGID